MLQTQPEMAESHAEEKKEDPKVQAPVLKVDLDSNVEDSVAYSLLDDWAKKLGKRQAHRRDLCCQGGETAALPDLLCTHAAPRALPVSHVFCAHGVV